MADAVGPGPPGMALECVAMAHEYLGSEFDIHCGGMDLVFPHHENEIAQAQAAGDGFARLWLHNGWVTMGGEKMSKSLGNVLAIPAVLQRVRPAELRYYLRQRPLSVNAGVHRDRSAGRGQGVHRHRGVPAPSAHPGGGGGSTTWTPKFAAALDDDLAVPAALAEIHATRAEGNRALEAGDHDTALAKAGEIRSMTAILGCDPLNERWETRDETASALAALDVLAGAELERRSEARRSRDWAAADAIRDRLKAAGIEVTDTADGPQWTLFGQGAPDGR